MYFERLVDSLISAQISPLLRLLLRLLDSIARLWRGIQCYKKKKIYMNSKLKKLYCEIIIKKEKYKAKILMTGNSSLKENS